MNARFGMDDKTPDPVEIKPHWSHLWVWFWTLRDSAPLGMNGPQPFQYSEIECWMRLTGEIVRRDEITTLKAMDSAYLEALYKERDDQRKREEEKTS